jgi:hypothetical protein
MRRVREELDDAARFDREWRNFMALCSAVTWAGLIAIWIALFVR